MPKKSLNDEHLLEAGFSQVEITPAGSLEMGGYLARTEPAKGMHDPLRVKAVSFQNKHARAILLSLDLLCLSSDWCKRLKAKIETSFSVPAENIMLAATHTHSGPAVFFPAALQNEALIAYEQAVSERCLQAAKQATEAAMPSVLKASSAPTRGVSRNRRSPNAPSDNLLSVVRVEATSGKVRGHLVSFSCHPTVMPPENLQFSADLFGTAAACVEKRHPDSCCVMFNGAAGDLSTRFTRKAQTWEELDRLGKSLGRQILRAGRNSEPIKGFPICGKSERMKLPFRAIPSVTDAQKACDQAKTEYTAAKLRAKKNWIAMARARLDGASGQLMLSRPGGWKPLFGSPEIDLELQTIRVGDLIFCGLPGEFFGRRGPELCRTANPKKAFVMGYANGYCGYAVPPAEISRGGYEQIMSPLNMKDEPKILKEVKGLIRQLKQLPGKTANA